MIKRLAIGLGAVLLGLYAVSLLMTAFAPKPLAGLQLAMGRWAAGLEAKTVETPLGAVHYLEGGPANAEAVETVVLVHGLFARKEHWLDLAPALADGYRVLALDLPGFGDNPVLPEGNYAYRQQLANLIATLDALGVYRAHFAGSSMGGQLIGMLAMEAPERVASLAFIGSPAGIVSAEPSPFIEAMEAGEAPLVVETEEDFEARLDMVFPKRPYAPRAIVKVWMQEEIARAEDNKRIWAEVVGSFARIVPLEALAPGLVQPALIVWCREDAIIDYSGAGILLGALPDGELVTLSPCGHVPMVDKPAETGAAYRAFLDGLAR